MSHHHHADGSAADGSEHVSTPNDGDKKTKADAKSNAVNF